MRKICVVTGSRAEYGIMNRLIGAIDNDTDLELQIIATNMHLSPEFGLTYREIERDGFTINKKVEMLLSSDTASATAKSVGLATIGFADAYEDLKPDMILVLGDRYEILAAVQTALFYKIPVAHLHGGEITEGAYDDCIRHSISKMSHFHFTSTEEYRNRVIQLGESPDRVFNVGALGVENIKKIELIPQEELERDLDFEFTDKCFSVTYHPVTLGSVTAEQQTRDLLDALNEFPEYKILFTMPNSDTDGRVIIKMINEYVARNPQRCKAFTSLGLRRYLSTLRCVTAVVGNSSSGIIEVPSFGIPTLNIGDRQKGRISADSVVHCKAYKSAIEEGIAKIISMDCKDTVNPYDKPNTKRSILEVIKSCPIENIIQKSFYNL